MSVESSPTVIKYTDGVKVFSGCLKMLLWVKIVWGTYVPIHTAVCGSVMDKCTEQIYGSQKKCAKKVFFMFFFQQN